jgi:hypothetical protein
MWYAIFRGGGVISRSCGLFCLYTVLFEISTVGINVLFLGVWAHSATRARAGHKHELDVVRPYACVYFPPRLIKRHLPVVPHPSGNSGPICILNNPLKICERCKLDDVRPLVIIPKCCPMRKGLFVQVIVGINVLPRRTERRFPVRTRSHVRSVTRTCCGAPTETPRSAQESECPCRTVRINSSPRAGTASEGWPCCYTVARSCITSGTDTRGPVFNC